MDELAFPSLCVREAHRLCRAAAPGCTGPLSDVVPQLLREVGRGAAARRFENIAAASSVFWHGDTEKACLVYDWLGRVDAEYLRRAQHGAWPTWYGFGARQMRTVLCLSATTPCDPGVMDIVDTFEELGGGGEVVAPSPDAWYHTSVRPPRGALTTSAAPWVATLPRDTAWMHWPVAMRIGLRIKPFMEWVGEPNPGALLSVRGFPTASLLALEASLHTLLYATPPRPYASGPYGGLRKALAMTSDWIPPTVLRPNLSTFETRARFTLRLVALALLDAAVPGTAADRVATHVVRLVS